MLSNYSYTEIKSVCDEDEIFKSLSDLSKKSLVNQAIQDVANYRNSLEKEDYKFDSSGAAQTPSASLTSVIGVPNKLLTVLASYNSGSPVFTTIEQGGKTGWTSYANISLTYDSINKTVLVDSDSEFTEGRVYCKTTADWTWERISSNRIKFTIPSTWSVVTLKIEVW